MDWEVIGGEDRTVVCPRSLRRVAAEWCGNSTVIAAFRDREAAIKFAELISARVYSVRAEIQEEGRST